MVEIEERIVDGDCRKGCMSKKVAVKIRNTYHFVEN